MCDHVTTQGWLDLFRPIVSSLFVQHRVPTQRLQRFINQRLRSQMDRRAADEKIQHWINRASHEELLNLPDMLQKSRLNLLADKIRQKINRFQTFVIRCTA